MFPHGTATVILALMLCCRGSAQPTLSSYEEHPCNRDCLTSTSDMTCEYNFTIEHYQTLSRACYNCPRNISDCFRPHCISADGGLRAVKVVNRMMPGPAINVCKGDMIVVNVYNQQHDFEGASIHWHGILQKGSPHMDGVPMITQCPIPSHSMFQYRFSADNAGTHFWHAHSGMQRSDGIFGTLVVRDTMRTTAMTHYDIDLPEHTVIVHDWLDQYTSSKFTLHHHGMSDNEPSSILINGRGSAFSPDVSGAHGGHAGMDMSDNHVMEDNKMTTTTSSSNMHEGHMMGDMTDHSMHSTTKSDVHADHADHAGMDLSTSHDMGTHETNDNAQHTPRSVFRVRSGQRFRFRFISNGILNCPLKVSVENHSLAIIASDGYDMDRTEVDSFTIFAGERYDVILSANQPVGNYWMYVVGLGDCANKKTFETAILRYEGAMQMEPVSHRSYDNGFKPAINANPFHFTSDAVTVSDMTSDDNDVTLLQSQDVKKFYVGMDFNNVENYRYFDADFYSLATIKAMHTGSHGNHLYALQMNRITFNFPMSPVLTQYKDVPESVFCNETSNEKDCHTEFCDCVHRIKVAIGDVVELVLVSEAVNGMGNHPMHLHGHAFYVLGMEKLNASITRSEVKRLDTMGKLRRNLVNPVRKDTVMVPDGGYTVIRFLADNPGFWFFHCHVEFHLSLGLALLLQVGEPDQMVQPPGNFPRCGNWKYSTDSSQYSYTVPCTSEGSSTISTTNNYLLSVTIFYISHNLLLTFLY